MIDNAEYFNIGTAAVLYVFLGMDGHVYHPPVLYLRVDKNFVPLINKPSINDRIEWERLAIARICSDRKLPESLLHASNKEFRKWIESETSIDRIGDEQTDAPKPDLHDILDR